MKRVLLVAGEKQLDPEMEAMGSTKDISFRISMLENLGFQVDIFPIKGRNDKLAVTKLRALNLAQYSIILLEHTVWRKTLKYLRDEAVSSRFRIFVRAHNAEGAHSLDRLKAFFITNKCSAILLPRQFIALTKSLINSFVNDLVSVVLADRVLPCNELEVPLYWNRIKNLTRGRADIFPINTATSVPQTSDSEVGNTNILFVGSYLPNLFTDHSLYLLEKNFINFKYDDLKFTLSGAYEYPVSFWNKPNICFRLFETVDEFHAVLTKSHCVLLLAEYGWGVKTRIFEILASGKPLIMHKNQKKLVPLCLRPYVMFWEGSTQDLRDIIRQTRHIEPIMSDDPYQTYLKESETQYKDCFI